MRIIQIGVGSFAKTWRVGLAEIPDLQVVGLVDTNTDALDEARAHFGLPQERCFVDPCLDWHKQLDADLIIDSTPHPFHYENAMRAFQAGMHVLVVKPMSDDYHRAQMMVSEAERNGRKLVVELAYDDRVDVPRSFEQNMLRSIWYLKGLAACSGDAS